MAAQTTPKTDLATTAGTGALNADTGRGTTTVADSVVAKVAGIAAREVEGVYDLGGGAARVIGTLRGAINNTDLAQGISVAVDENSATVDLTIVVDYPHPLHAVADDVRASVIDAIENLVGLAATAVNVAIDDVHIESAATDETAAK